MEINAKHITVGSVAGTIILVGSVLKVFDLGWSDVGWKTPDGHSADIAGLRSEFVAAAGSADQETIDFRKEWRCSEWAEDLEKLYKEQAAGDHSQRMKDRIKGLRERMDDAGCDKYEDY